MGANDPTAFIRGVPVYFDFHTGKTVHFAVNSAKQLTKLTYTGVAFKDFTIEIKDLGGRLITSVGPFNYGNTENTIEVPLPNISRFEVIVNDHSSSWILIEKMGFGAEDASSEVVTTSAPVTSSGPNEHPASTVALTEDQARAVVLVKGDNAEGTGFLVKTADGPVVVTNIHVISNNPNLKITTNTGSPITILSYKGAADRDLAMIAIKDGPFSYLTLATDVSGTAQPGDEVITPGNSEGGEVMLNTVGKVLGIGPERVEFSNPIYHGNSGGPVFHSKSGKVLGVVTAAMKVDVSNDLDKASFASRSSAIGNSIRYFGLRLDTVSDWVQIDWQRFQNETLFLDQFHEQSRRLDAYLNTPEEPNHPKKKRKKKEGDGSDAPNGDSAIYLTDPKIMQANDRFEQQAAGSDTSQRIELLREYLLDLQGVAEINLDRIKIENNFYSFDQERVHDELAYRNALRTELDALSNNIERLDELPRTNN